MSLFSNSNKLIISLPDGLPETSVVSAAGGFDGFTFENVMRTVDEVVTMTKTYNGLPIVFTTTPRLAACGGSLTYNGVQFNYSVGHGRGICNADTYRTTGPNDSTNFSVLNGVLYAVDVTGDQDDGSTLWICAAKNLYVGVDPSGSRMIYVTNPSFWGHPGSISPPVPLNTTQLTGFNTYVDTQLGYNGDNNVMRFYRKCCMPDIDELTAQKWALRSPNTMYGNILTFPQMRSINLLDGTTQIVDPGIRPAYAAWQPGLGGTPTCYMFEVADGSAGYAAYSPISAMGPYGFFMGRYDTTSGNVVCWNGPPQYVDGIPPGTFEDLSFGVIGSRSQIVASVLKLYGSNP